MHAADQNLVEINSGKVCSPQVIVKYANHPDIKTKAAHGKARGYSIRTDIVELPEMAVIDTATMVEGANQTPAEALAIRIGALMKSGAFEYVEPDYIVHADRSPSDARFIDGTLWGLNNLGQQGGVSGADIQAVNAWDLSIGSTNIIVAVIDTGVRYTHQDLAAQMWRNPGEIPGNGIDDDGDGIIDDVYGINAITGSGDPMDDNGHGTHVSGTIGAAANDGHPHVGVAWNVQIMACKFLADDGFGSLSDAIQCINFAVKKGARILNNSWGGGPFTQSLFDAIANARKAGVLFVAAAGNDGVDNDRQPHYPASYELDNIISVAALDRFDKIADFSDFGRTSVHIGAPGVEIFSTWNGSDSDYNTIQGTSMATPHVSGVAALIWGQNSRRTMGQVRDRILRAAVPIPALSGVCTRGGRLFAVGALQAEADGILEVTISPPPGAILLAGTNQTFSVTVSDDIEVTNATVIVQLGQGTPVRLGNPPNSGIYTGLVPLPATPGSFSVHFDISAPGKQAFQTNLTYYAAVAPLNDNFETPSKVSQNGATVVGDNRLATLQAREPVHGDVQNVAASVWYVWSPPVTTSVIIDTAGSSFDAVVAVYTGSTISNLFEVVSADDVGNKKDPYVIFQAIGGETYHIAVAGKTGEVGDVQLRIEPNGAPDFTLPTVFIDEPLSGSTIFSTVRQIVISGTANDPAPNVSGVRQVQVKVNDADAVTASGTTRWITTNLLDFGENTIRVVAFDNAENVSATKTVTVTLRPPPLTNDFFVQAFPLNLETDFISGTNTLATKEPDEPMHAGNAGGKSVWFAYTNSVDGLLLFSTEGSQFDTLLAVYTGPSIHSLTNIASNDDANNGVSFSDVTISVRAGEIYHVAVDGFAGASGYYELHYVFNPTQVFPVTTSANGEGMVVPSSGNFPIDSTVSIIAVPASHFSQFLRFTDILGNVVSTKNPLDIFVTGPTNLVAVFGPKQFTDDFETGDFSKLPWQTTTWVVTQDPVSLTNKVARSTASDPDKPEVNSLVLSLNLDPGTAAFDYKVSSETNYDKLEFFVNNQLQSSWSGEVGWATYSFQVTGGVTTLEWRYITDTGVINGLNAGFIDNIDLPLHVQGNTPQPGSLSISRNPDQSLAIQIAGQPEAVYEIQGSINFQQWTTIGTATADASGKASFSDPQSAAFPYRFYRTITQ